MFDTPVFKSVTYTSNYNNTHSHDLYKHGLLPVYRRAVVLEDLMVDKRSFHDIIE